MSGATIIPFVADRGRKAPKETPGPGAFIVLPVIRIERLDSLGEPYRGPSPLIIEGAALLDRLRPKEPK